MHVCKSTSLDGKGEYFPFHKESSVWMSWLFFVKRCIQPISASLEGFKNIYRGTILDSSHKPIMTFLPDRNRWGSVVWIVSSMRKLSVRYCICWENWGWKSPRVKQQYLLKQKNSQNVFFLEFWRVELLHLLLLNAFGMLCKSKSNQINFIFIAGL